jgi:hypothetical protein
MGRTCNTNGIRGTRIGYSWDSQMEGDYLEDLDVVG